MTISCDDPFVDLNDVLFARNASDLPRTKPSSGPNHRFQPIPQGERKRSRPDHHDPPAMLVKDKEKPPSTNLYRPIYRSAPIGTTVQSSQISIPKKSFPGINVRPFSMATHAQDRQEFQSPRVQNNNVQREYDELVSGSKASYTEHLLAQQERKREIFTPNKAAKLSPLPLHKQDYLNRTSPAALQSLHGASTKRQQHWKSTGAFAVKKPTSTASLITKSYSDASETLPKSIVTERRVISVAPRLSSSPPPLPAPSASLFTARHRPGSTVENPVELSDDDDDEREDQEIASSWNEFSTDIAIGEIWLGRCRLVCHGPSRLRLDITQDRSRKHLTIEFTPYMIEKIPVSNITTTKLYSRLSGGCTFLSVLVHPHHEWRPWSQHYKFRDRSSDPVWITMFFGASTQREALENTARDLPAINEIPYPSDHLDIVRRNLIDQYPCRTSRLDSESKIHRRKARKLIVCKYPEGQRDCVTITNADLESLDPHEFLNDTVIDFKLAHLRLHDTQPKISYHVFSSFFYKRFVTSNMSYDSVKRWTDKLDLFQKDFWLIPICESLHWTLAVVCYPNILQSDTRQPVMLYYDSLGGSGRRAFEVIKRYIVAALKQPGKLRRAESLYKIENDFQYINVQAPKQTNSYDCGIYLLLFAEYFMKSPPTNVLAPHAPEWFEKSVADAHRHKIRDEILRIAYSQSPGNPSPVSTDYVKAPTYIDDDDEIDVIQTVDEVSDRAVDDRELILVS